MSAQDVGKRLSSEKREEKGSDAPRPGGRALLKNRHLRSYFVFLAGLIVFLPAILSPFFLDDYLHASMAEGTFPAKRSAFDFYNFVDDGDRAVLVERGLVPWWASPNLTIRFFRPLSSALLYLDHKVFGHEALPMHLHSLVWWVLAVVIARSRFRASFSPRVAAIATAIFALAPCHAMPLAWLANREALVSIVFGLLALGAYTKWREENRVKSAVVAALFFALAMLGGGEYALSFGGYVLAIEIVRRGDALVRRITGMLPF